MKHVQTKKTDLKSCVKTTNQLCLGSNRLIHNMDQILMFNTDQKLKKKKKIQYVRNIQIFTFFEVTWVKQKSLNQAKDLFTVHNI